MNRSPSTLVKTLATIASVGALGVSVFASTPAYAQWAPPPPEYVASTEPVYYGGHAHYYYGGHWYYRDGANWRHYDREPPELYQRRLHYPPVHHEYGRHR
jgi:hypothetical protein